MRRTLLTTRNLLRCKSRIAAAAFLLETFFAAAPAVAAGYVPREDAEVLERLYGAPTRLVLEQLRRERKGPASRSADPEDAADVAERFLLLARSEGEPRFYGRAEAALAPWRAVPQAPPRILLLRSVLRQHDHDFDGALDDLDRLLAAEPRNWQAHWTRAGVLQAMGDYARSRKACEPLIRAAGADPALGLRASACVASIDGLSGRAEAAYASLRAALAKSPRARLEERLWAMTLLGEISLRLGRRDAAESHFRQALLLGSRDVGLLRAYADLLLERGAADRAAALLAGPALPDALLIRLALAEKALGAATLDRRKRELSSRFAAAVRRGEPAHLREQARFTLLLLEDPRAALKLARRNWESQREPEDALVLMEAALAARSPDAAMPALEWQKRTGLEDARLSKLARRLRIPRR